MPNGSEVKETFALYEKWRPQPPHKTDPDTAAETEKVEQEDSDVIGLAAKLHIDGSLERAFKDPKNNPGGLEDSDLKMLGLANQSELEQVMKAINSGEVAKKIWYGDVHSFN